MLGDHVREVAHDHAEAHRQAAGAGAHAAARDVDEPLPCASIDDAEAGDAQSRVDAEDPAHRQRGSRQWLLDDDGGAARAVTISIEPPEPSVS